jgi:predicted HTH transcriptional regulator
MTGLILAILGGLLVGYVVGVRRRPDATPEFDGEDEVVLGEARAAVAARIERRLARIMEKAIADGRITNDGAEELFCISDRTASNYLGILTKRGRLTREGAGRSTFYTPK